MENNTVTTNPQSTTIPYGAQSIGPQPQGVIPIQPPIESQPKKNLKKLIIVLTSVFLILGILVYFFYRNAKRNLGANYIENTYDKDGTKYTNIQYDDLNQKSLSTSCFSSVIPKSARVVSAGINNDCTIQVVMPDTTLEFVKVIAIDENEKQSIRDAAYSADELYRKLFSESGNTKYESKISENVNFGGFNSYILNYYDGSMNWQTYFIEVPESKNYKVKGLKVRGFFISGMANDPSIDVFSKYYKELITNLRFK